MTTYANVGHILLKRGNTAQSTSYTGPLGELTYDTDLGTVRVHDNATAGIPTHDTGAPGDVAGMVALDSNWMYYCVANYTTGSAVIWKRTAWSGETW